MKITLSIFFVLASKLCLSQSKYFPGFIVNNNGDTVYGLISHKDWDFNPSKIEFKKDSLSAEYETLQVKDIKAFALTGIVDYERYACNISMSPIDINELQTGPGDGKVNKEIFLKSILINNSLKLFVYRDKIKERYFVLRGEETVPEELIYRVYYKSKDANSIIKEEIYKQQIIAIAEQSAANDKLKKRILYLQYDLKSIRTFLVDMANPGPQAKNIQNPRGKSNAVIKFFIVGGISLFKVKEHADYFNNVKKPGTSLSPHFELGIDIVPNKYIHRDFLRLEITYSYLRYTTNGQDSLSGYQRQTQQNIATGILGVAGLYNYIFYQKNKIKLFAGGGLGYLIIPREKATMLSKYYSSGVLVSADSYTENRAYSMLEADLAIGLKINNRYNVDISNRWPFITKIGSSYLSFSVGYQF